MPKTKQPYERYYIIDDILVNRKYASIRDFQEAMEEKFDKAVSERSIKRSIEDMRYDRHLGFFAPIVYDHGQRKYHYSIPGYSIRRLALKQEEFESLVFASRLVDQFRQVKVLENVEAAIQKIADQLKIRQTISEAEIGEFVDFEKPAETKGSEFIGPLLNAIWRKKVVRILYHGFNKPRPYPQTLHPYLLKEYRHRWYIFGYNDYWKELRIYSLDRILSVDTDYETQYMESKLPPKDYFQNVIGVTRFEGTEPRKVRIKFSAHQAPYVLTQPLHESQEIEEQTEEYTIITLNVHESPELDIILLGWNKEVEILDPPEYREKIRKLHAEAARLY